jgi:hypothetical protein
MAFSEYALLVSLSAAIHAHGEAGGISIGPETITQPNGGAGFKVAVDSKHKGITATATDGWKWIKTPGTAVPLDRQQMRHPAFNIPSVKGSRR